MPDVRNPDSPPYGFDPAAFHAELDRALGVAADVRAPVKTQGVERVQAGQKILVFKCPVCQQIGALSGEGRHKCHSCSVMRVETWLQVERAG